MADKVFIVILNWNGWKDTIECLESIRLLNYSNYRAVVLDNGSNDDSLKQINGWAVSKNIYTVCYDRNTCEQGGDRTNEENLSKSSAADKIVIVDNNENLGFAAGNNVGIRYALAKGADYVWILNNDTVVDKGSLSHLISFMELNDIYHGVSPQIRLYDKPDIIWNCGGILKWYGARKYYYANQSIKSVPKSGFGKISFITGCAALLHISVFRELGLLTENFFHGEEDFELSLRMKKKRFKMACVYNAVIYHKVSSSSKESSRIGQNYIYYLCRFINMRQHWPNFIWHIWRILYAPYIFAMLKVKNNLDSNEILSMLRTLYKNSMTLDKVNREITMRALGYKNYKLRKLD